MPLGAGIDVGVCSVCGGPMRIIVGMPNHSIEDPMVIGEILSRLEVRMRPVISKAFSCSARRLQVCD